MNKEATELMHRRQKDFPSADPSWRTLPMPSFHLLEIADLCIVEEKEGNHLCSSFSRIQDLLVGDVFYEWKSAMLDP